MIRRASFPQRQRQRPKMYHLSTPLNLPFLFFFLVLSCWSLTSRAAVNEDELRSLLEFKKGIQEDPLSLVSNSWSRSSDLDEYGCPKTWHGVVCDEESGSITALVLEELGLGGELKFSTLTGLKKLANLSLAGNSLRGRLVPAMGGMSSLQHLDLSRNEFYGPIPGRINELWNLHYLNLSENKFSGGFPERVDNLQQLRMLDLHKNGLWGDVGSLMAGLRNVEHVDLSDNKFFGGLEMGEDDIWSLVNTVKHMNLSYNKLNGKFFEANAMSLLKSLEVLDLGYNQLRGELPSFGLMASLRILRVGSNQLFGSIPEELFESLVPLEELDLSGNGFSGSIHSINSTTLKVLNLSSNVLSGPLPSTLEGCVMIDLSGNMISGDISVIQNWGDTLEVIDFSSNTLTGSFPNLTSQYGKLISINVRNNSLEGDLPTALGFSPKLSAVDLSSNKLSGSVPNSFFTSITLTNLNLSGNHFTGVIPVQGSHTTELLVLATTPQIESLDLSDNSLSGPLPSGISYLGRLKLLKLGKNSLSGHLPGEMSKLSFLEYLDLSMNKFDGSIPDRLPSSLKGFNVSYNDLQGHVPESLMRFPSSSFHPGNRLLIFPHDMPSGGQGSGAYSSGGHHHNSKASIRVAIIVASVGAAVMIAFVLLAYYRAQIHEFHGRAGFGSETTGRDAKLGRFARPLFNFQRGTDPPPTSLSFSNDHLLTSHSRSIHGQRNFVTETVEHGLPVARVVDAEARKSDVQDIHIASGWRSSPGSPLSSAPNLIETCEQPALLNVYSPDRLAGELFFLDNSLIFTAEELSHAPAEVLGRSSHGTLYKATLDSGHVLTVKWLRVGLVKHKKEFAKEAKKIGSIRHPNIVSLRAYYWGPREQERLILADYIRGDSLSLHLYESTPRRYSRLSFSQRLKIAVDVARSLCHLHDRGLSHGNLKPTNILLTTPELTARLTDYGLHRLMTPAGTAEQLLNLRALGYGAPELANVPKPLPSFKADVYAFGVILMELLTRRSAGDIISGQTGAVDLQDWVRLCAQEGRGVDCFDRDIAGGEEPSKAMDDLLATSLKCILPVNERPSIRTVFDDLSSISV